MTSASTPLLGIVRRGILQRGDAQRKAHGLELCGAQRLFEERDVVARHAHDGGVPFAARAALGSGGVQRGDVARETALGLDGEEAGDIGLGQVGQFHLHGERPFEGRATTQLRSRTPAASR